MNSLDKTSSGIVVAVPTPFDDRCAPDIALFLGYCGWLIDKGCDGRDVLGSTGEASAQTDKTRADIMRWVMRSSPSRYAPMELTDADQRSMEDVADRLGYSRKSTEVVQMFENL